MFKEWRYRLEKGRPHLILLVGLLIVIVGIICLGGVLVYVSGVGETLRESLWWTFLHVSDPGYLGDDDTPITAVFGTLFTILGMITFVAGLVGILTSLITSGLIGLREGGAPLVFRDHIVILGWNSRIFTLIADLLHADGEHRIAVLGSIPKTEAEQRLERRVFDRIGRREGDKAAHRARGRVVYRQGSPTVEHDLNRIAATSATRFILLADESATSDTATDVAQIRTLYSIERAHSENGSFRDRLTTVVELASERFRSHAFFAMKADPRLDAWVSYYEEQLRRRGERSYLPALGVVEDSRNDMTAVNTDQITSRVIVQCAVQPFMSGVYDELFSFQGKELFLWQPGPAWKRVWEDMLALPNAERPGYLNERVEEGLVIGCFDGQHFIFDPASWSPLGGANQYVVLGDKQRWNEEPMEVGSQQQYLGECALTAPELAGEYRVLVLGLSRRFKVVMEQFTDFADQYPQTSLTIDVLADRDARYELGEHTGSITLNMHRGDPTHWAVLGEMLESQEPYHTIVLMADDLEVDNPEVDARVTMTLLMLRAFRDDKAWLPRLERTNLVAEVRDPRNRQILRQEQLAGDVVVGDEYVSGFIAQVCVDHRLEELYREILDYGRYEIYARQLQVEDDKPRTFGDLVRACALNEETAIGFLQSNGTGGMRPVMAPPMYAQVTAADMPLVLADD
jgi:hypothetical protein